MTFNLSVGDQQGMVGVGGVMNRQITSPSNEDSKMSTYRNTDIGLPDNPTFLQKSEIKIIFYKNI